MTQPMTPREKVFVSESCEGEHCRCGSPAVRKVGEEIMHDDPRPQRHNLTAYVCARHFSELMGPAGARSVGYTALASGSGDPDLQKMQFGGGDHAELARLAEAATPGPWKACGTIYEHMNCEVRSGIKGEGQAIAQVWDGPNAFKDGQFIAAARAAVSALIEENAALRAERDGLKRAEAVAVHAADTMADRATEAARYLAEARTIIEEGLYARTDKFEAMARTFISSTEAERG